MEVSASDDKKNKSGDGRSVEERSWMRSGGQNMASYQMCTWNHPILNLLQAGRFRASENDLDKNNLISKSEEPGSGQPFLQIEKENKHFQKQSETDHSLKIAQHPFASSCPMYTIDNIKNIKRAKTTATKATLSVSKRRKTSLFDPVDTYQSPSTFL